jgi:hypothetical protein
VHKLEKLTLIVLRARDPVNVSLSSISTPAHYDSGRAVVLAGNLAFGMQNFGISGILTSYVTSYQHDHPQKARSKLPDSKPHRLSNRVSKSVSPSCL